MKKVLVLAIMCLLSLSFVLTGCSLFPHDQAKYLAAPVLKITMQDDKDLIVEKKDFITAFNNYGAQLLNSGMEIEKAVQKTLDVLINRELMLYDAQKTITLENADLNDIWQETFDSVISNIGTYEEKVIKDWKLTVPSEFTEEETSTTEYIPYEKQANIKLVDGEYVIVLENKNENTDKNEELVYTIGEEISSIKVKVTNKISNSSNKDVLTEATRQYAEQLLKNEKGLNLSTSQEDALTREIERIYTAVKENKYIEIYENNLRGDNNISYITVSQVLRKLSSKMLSSYSEYKINVDSYSKDMLESFKDVGYVMDNNYFFVSHILLKYEDGSTSQIENLKTAYKNKTISQKAYQDGLAIEAEKINALNIKSNEREELSPADLFKILETEMTGKSAEAKTEIFKDYIYTYNEDPGIMNAEYCYVIGKNDSKMVEEFTKVSRELWDNGNGEYGSIGYCLSEYGVHIIFYAGPVTNNGFEIVDPDTFTLVTEDKDYLTKVVNTISNTKLNEFNNKTIFDLIYEGLAKDNYSIFESFNMEAIRKSAKSIIDFPANYNDIILQYK